MGKGFGVEVLVVGAGVFGLSCAWACLRRGMRVVVADEAAAPGAGASGGLVGALSPHSPERWSAKKRFQLAALLAAPAEWAQVAAAGGVDPGYARVGRLIPLASEAARALAETRARAAQELWGGAAVWEVADPAPDWLARQAAAHGAVHETLSARVAPRAAVAALAAAVVARGGELRCGWRALAVEDGSVRFDGGPVKAGAVILATGATGGPTREPPLRGVKGQAALLAATAPERTPLIYEDGVYVVPQPSRLVAVGATSEDTWDDPAATDARLEEVIARARALCPALRDAPIVERWAGLRPRGPRPDPMLGPLPGRERVYLASGGFKTGFGLAFAVGEAMADMVEGAALALPPGFTLAAHMAAAAEAVGKRNKAGAGERD